MSPDSGLGGISEDELRVFMAARPGFADADVSLMARFARSVGELLAKRFLVAEVFETAVFVLSESLAMDVEGRSVLHAPFLSAGNDNVGSRIWLCQAQVRDAYALASSVATAGPAFTAVTDGGFGARPTVVVDGRGDAWHVRFYPEGLATAEAWIPVEISDAPIAEEDLKRVIHRFWYQGLRTPDQARRHPLKMWKSAKQGVPLLRPEARIQARLRDVLFGAFPQHFVRAEVPTEEGRADIFLVSHASSASGAPAQVTDWVLELKALADKTASGEDVGATETKSAITKGVAQATLYRHTQNGVQAAVCCFDMRGTNELDQVTFAHVISSAAANQIRLWRWMLFRSSNDARMAAFSGGSC